MTLRRLFYESMAPSLDLFVNLSHEPSHEIEKRGWVEEVIESGGEVDKQEQWIPLCALIWPCYSSSFSTHECRHTHTHRNTHRHRTVEPRESNIFFCIYNEENIIVYEVLSKYI